MKYWTTRRGEKIAIKDMTKEHVYNTLCYVTGRLINDPSYLKTTPERLRHFWELKETFAKELDRRYSDGHNKMHGNKVQKEKKLLPVHRSRK